LPAEAHVTKKSLGNTVLGWFVVREGEDGEAEAETEADADAGGDPEVAALLADESSPPAETAPKPTKKAAAPPPKAAPSPQKEPPRAPAPAVRLEGHVPEVAAGTVPDASVFAQVYRAAKITDDEQQRVEKVLGLLESLPTETPKEVRRHIVEASLKAFGIPLDQIIEASAQEIQALEAYIQHGERHTQSVLSDAGSQIEKLVVRMNEIKKLMELQVKTQQSLVRSSNEQKLRVQAVLEFFGQEAVARVVKESPKLVEMK
jgi:hypothetical protein